ncbi:MAG: CPBP family intramembrane glutamic endopeptidase [Anaerolineae bacterium]|jgi:membrane protease YdiL (CAAX protease family)|nr:CPBP family intramembrane glutamic endopeptidase [Anaerolineae bacterium]
MRNTTFWKIITAIELAVAAAVILLDLFLPTLVILCLIALSLLIRREHIHSLGFKRPQSWSRTAGIALAGAVSLQLFDIGIVMPILNRVTGTTIDYSGFAHLKGNLAQLLLLLALSWTLAALGEEIVYRGYLQKLLAELFGSRLPGILLMVGVSSLLFGFAHTEQGLIGIVVTTLDALFFSWLKLKCGGNLWVTILAHGFYNSIGVLVFYFTGPFYGLW